jgi:hypothetical protein
MGYSSLINSSRQNGVNDSLVVLGRRGWERCHSADDLTGDTVGKNDLGIRTRQVLQDYFIKHDLQLPFTLRSVLSVIQFDMSAVLNKFLH